MPYIQEMNGSIGQLPSTHGSW